MRAGGLTGTLWASSITNSFSMSDVTGKNDVGGLVGDAKGGVRFQIIRNG